MHHKKAPVGLHHDGLKMQLSEAVFFAEDVMCQCVTIDHQIQMFDDFIRPNRKWQTNSLD